MILPTPILRRLDFLAGAEDTWRVGMVYNEGRRRSDGVKRSIIIDTEYNHLMGENWPNKTHLGETILVRVPDEQIHKLGLV